MAAELQQQEETTIDPRMYVSILLFRWQLIAVIFFWSLFIAVIYIQFIAEKKYLTHCNLMIYRDPNLLMSQGDAQRWDSFNMHTYLLQSDEMRKRAVSKLMERYGAQMGFNDKKMRLSVAVNPSRKINWTLEINVKSQDPAYAQEFLKQLLVEHESEWNDIQKKGVGKATEKLNDQLKQLKDQIYLAESEKIEYMRLNDIARVEARSGMEARYLAALMERKNQLKTEMMLLEASYPDLKNADPEVIHNVGKLNRETGAIEPLPEEISIERNDKGEAILPVVEKTKISTDVIKNNEEEKSSDKKGWQDLREKLLQLKQKEKELAKNLKPEHPQYKSLMEEINKTQEQLDIAARVEMARLKDRHKELLIALNAIETAEFIWKSDSMLASERRSEVDRMVGEVQRFKERYNSFSSKVDDIKIEEELKSEQLKVIEEVTTDPSPVWPDPLKILLMALAVGLGGGIGVALLLQVFDNKLQTIHDVEKSLGIPFLGGVPYWVHGGLEKAIRPIVTEEHSTGAVEAYRALRTNIVQILSKMNEKVVLVTSADSREGKTLTVLNLSILVAQMGKKVLLIDMDLRRGRLHRSLGHEREPGVIDILRDNKPIRSAIVKTRFDNLDFVPSGSSADNVAEILQASDISGVISDIHDDYDYIFIDTSPILRVTDTSIIMASKIGVVVYIAKVNKTPKPMIRYSMDLIKEANIIGMIINSIEMHKISSLYYAYQYPNYAYYSNAYAYGYDYYYYGDKTAASKFIRRRRGTWDKKRFEFLQWLKSFVSPD